MKIQAGSWKAFLGVVQVHGDNPWSSYLTRPDPLLRKSHSKKQWPQLIPKAFTSCLWTPRLSHLFFAASDYIGLLDLALFTKICIRQSSFCSSWDFPTSLFSTQLLLPSVSASSPDYLSSYKCISTMLCCISVTCLALHYHMLCQLLFTTSMILSCKCWHFLALEVMLQFVRSLSNILIMVLGLHIGDILFMIWNFFPLLNCSVMFLN